MIQALQLAHESIQPLLKLQLEMQAAIGKTKSTNINMRPWDDALFTEVRAKTQARVRQIIVEETERAALDQKHAEYLSARSAHGAQDGFGCVKIGSRTAGHDGEFAGFRASGRAGDRVGTVDRFGADLWTTISAAGVGEVAGGNRRVRVAK
jgi:hypothetical protein